MKRGIIFFVLFLLVISLNFVSADGICAPRSSCFPGYIPFDAGECSELCESCVLGQITEGDDDVDIFDVIMLVNFILGSSEGPPDDRERCAADVTTDGTVDILDIIGIVSYILDLSTGDIGDDIIATCCVEAVSPVEMCSDVKDNDYDGFIDCDDSDCAGVGDCAGRSAPSRGLDQFDVAKCFSNGEDGKPALDLCTPKVDQCQNSDYSDNEEELSPGEACNIAFLPSAIGYDEDDPTGLHDYCVDDVYGDEFEEFDEDTVYSLQAYLRGGCDLTSWDFGWYTIGSTVPYFELEDIPNYPNLGFPDGDAVTGCFTNDDVYALSCYDLNEAYYVFGKYVAEYNGEGMVFQLLWTQDWDGQFTNPLNSHESWHDEGHSGDGCATGNYDNVDEETVRSHLCTYCGDGVLTAGENSDDNSLPSCGDPDYIMDSDAEPGSSQCYCPLDDVPVPLDGICESGDSEELARGPNSGCNLLTGDCVGCTNPGSGWNREYSNNDLVADGICEQAACDNGDCIVVNFDSNDQDLKSPGLCPGEIIPHVIGGMNCNSGICTGTDGHLHAGNGVCETDLPAPYNEHIDTHYNDCIGFPHGCDTLDSSCTSNNFGCSFGSGDYYCEAETGIFYLSEPSFWRDLIFSGDVEWNCIDGMSVYVQIDGWPDIGCCDELDDYDVCCCSNSPGSCLPGVPFKFDTQASGSDSFVKSWNQIIFEDMGYGDDDFYPDSKLMPGMTALTPLSKGWHDFSLILKRHPYNDCQPRDVNLSDFEIYGQLWNNECNNIPAEWKGDGFCDGYIFDGYNSPECDWDGGDCCSQTCVGDTDVFECTACQDCGIQAEDWNACLDPDYSEGGDATNPFEDCSIDSFEIVSNVYEYGDENDAYFQPRNWGCSYGGAVGGSNPMCLENTYDIDNGFMWYDWCFDSDLDGWPLTNGIVVDWDANCLGLYLFVGPSYSHDGELDESWIYASILGINPPFYIMGDDRLDADGDGYFDIEPGYPVGAVNPATTLYSFLYAYPVGLSEQQEGITLEYPCYSNFVSFDFWSGWAINMQPGENDWAIPRNQSGLVDCGYSDSETMVALHGDQANANSYVPLIEELYFIPEWVGDGYCDDGICGWFAETEDTGDQNGDGVIENDWVEICTGFPAINKEDTTGDGEIDTAQVLKVNFQCDYYGWDCGDCGIEGPDPNGFCPSARNQNGGKGARRISPTLKLIDGTASSEVGIKRSDFENQNNINLKIESEFDSLDTELILDGGSSLKQNINDDEFIIDIHSRMKKSLREDTNNDLKDIGSGKNIKRSTVYNIFTRFFDFFLSFFR